MAVLCVCTTIVKLDAPSYVCVAVKCIQAIPAQHHFCRVAAILSLWRLKRLVTLSTYRHYTNKCIYLFICLKEYRQNFQEETGCLRL